jgi:hypothetical protein
LSEEPVTEESSDDWEAVSDQTDAVEEEAEEAIDELYGPFRYEVMQGGESSSPQFIFGKLEDYEVLNDKLQSPSVQSQTDKP